MKKEKKKTLVINASTHKVLSKMGCMKDTFDDIILSLIESYYDAKEIDIQTGNIVLPGYKEVQISGKIYLRKIGEEYEKNYF